MAQIFPEWTNKLPIYIAIVIIIFAVTLTAAVWYYGSPEYKNVGYRPKQPVSYSHKLHAGEAGLDCRYCHSSVEISAAAVVPPTQTCMNCHKHILPTSDRLKLVRDSYKAKKRIEWVRVHNLPDYAYFDHSAHLYAGVGCRSCHGNVADMEIVMQTEPLNMSWCLKCHRKPEKSIRPQNEITNMNWLPPENHVKFAKKVIGEKNLSPPEDCWGCHR